MTQSRNINRKAHRWTLDELATVQQHYADMSTAILADYLGVSVSQLQKKASALRVGKSAAFLASAASGRMGPGHQRGAATRFKPGSVSHNKGVKGVCGVHPNSRKTQFQKGHTLNGELPLGTVKLMSNGYLMRKVAQTGYVPDDWKMESRLVWAAHFGPIPDDHVVHLRDRNPMNVVPENMELLSRGELVRRFGINALPQELKQVLRLKGALTRKINRHEQQKSADRA